MWGWGGGGGGGVNANLVPLLLVMRCNACHVIHTSNRPASQLMTQVPSHYVCTYMFPVPSDGDAAHVGLWHQETQAPRSNRHPHTPASSSSSAGRGRSRHSSRTGRYAARGRRAAVHVGEQRRYCRCWRYVWGPGPYHLEQAAPGSSSSSSRWRGWGQQQWVWVHPALWCHAYKHTQVGG
jgi:hypothetical protein